MRCEQCRICFDTLLPCRRLLAVNQKEIAEVDVNILYKIDYHRGMHDQEVPLSMADVTYIGLLTTEELLNQYEITKLDNETSLYENVDNEYAVPPMVGDEHLKNSQDINNTSNINNNNNDNNTPSPPGTLFDFRGDGYQQCNSQFQNLMHTARDDPLLQQQIFKMLEQVLFITSIS